MQSEVVSRQLRGHTIVLNLLFEFEPDDEAENTNPLLCSWPHLNENLVATFGHQMSSR
jgi:hypothetical protein